MGSPGCGAVDYGVGSIVWVRRRNGSWWPGKIVGSDELSCSHLGSPRSGTPVKLLGREDASVDWYNLEKSKRVKPFRCGEFDDCIERAEFSQGMPMKKREKYARKEDAVLHALELEQELLKDRGKLDQMTIESPVKKGILSLEHTAIDDINDGHFESHLFSKIIDVNYDNDVTDPSEGAQLSGENAHLEAKPRTRDLSETLVRDTDALAPLDGVCSIGNDSYANGMKQIDGAKRSKCMRLPTDSVESKESSHSQVEMSTNCLELGILPSQLDSLVEDDVSSSSENDSSDLETDSNSSMSDQEVDNYMAYHHDLMSKWQLKGKRNVRNLSKKSVRLKNEYFDDTTEQAQAEAMEEEYYITSKRVSKDQNLVGNYMSDWEDQQPDLKGYRDVKHRLYGTRHHFGGRLRTILTEVDLKVQANYQKEPVPIVSLVSKLNGQAIIGHPIQIEALQDGFSEALLSDCLGNQPAWRTARTANVRIPRTRLPTTVLGGEEASGPHSRRPSRDRRLPKKMSKKVSLSTNQKTRALSSIAVEPNYSNVPMHDSVTCRMNGLIKLESCRPPTVAYIPVKLVFSRLLEKINRPPSKATNNVVLLKNNSPRNS
ncbi:uncharacterized protein At1g51745-like [Cucurbita maxima]|uniref:Uncharacterized protein At1g51745-like n=1 Tax=Cucurbita maxima TaxID=3661 RepID=A0A6J1KWB9_CUCMA|nr:uncharacterized protein At1g51745-like [Cucurbita maxima]